MDEKQALVPRLRFPEFRDTGGWDNCNLGDISIVVRGGSPRPIDGFITKDNSGLSWLKIGDVNKDDKYVTKTQEKVRAEALSKTREVHPGDLILSNSMSFGRPYLMKIKSCIHDGWIAITEIEEPAEREYLYYLIFSPASQSYFLDNAAGSGVLNLNADIIKSLPIAFPAQTEQQKIADCLSSLDALIAAQADKINALKIHKKGMMQQLFPREGETVPRLRFPEFRDAGEWVESLLDDICHMQSGKFIAAAEISSIFEDGMFPCFGGNGLRGYTKTYNQSGRYSLIGRQGALCGNVNLVDGSFYATEHAVVTTPKSGISTDWLFYNLTLLNLNRFATGQAQPGLSVEVLDKVPCAVPRDEKEQEKIADSLSSLDALIAAHTEKLDALKTHKKGLMQQLFPSPKAVGV